MAESKGWPSVRPVLTLEGEAYRLQAGDIVTVEYNGDGTLVSFVHEGTPIKFYGRGDNKIYLSGCVHPGQLMKMIGMLLGLSFEIISTNVTSSREETHRFRLTESTS